MFKANSYRHHVVRVIVLCSIAIPFVIIFLPFFVPMLLAMFFAFGLEPIWKKIGSTRRQKRYFPLYLLVFCFFFLIIPFSFVGVKIVRLLQEFSASGTKDSQLFQSLNALWDKAFATVTKVLQTLNLEQDVLPNKDEIISKVSPVVVDKTTAFLSSIPESAMDLAVFFGMLIVFVTSTHKIRDFFISIDILPKEELDGIIDSLKRNCYMTLISTFLIGMLQAVIVATGASIFGFHEFWLIFIVTFLLSFIPVIGAAPVSFVLALSALLMGQSGNAIGLLVVTAIAGSIDNIIKPFVFSGQEEGVNAFVALLGIIGAIIVFGLPGLLLGPLLLQVGVELIPKIVSALTKTTKL
ncbi:MAG: AI-2E family transporter [Bdellovibrionaceae bacterium]|nr:AI-2E family transporter [Pseudobdellovibrionaceae bacterium]